MNKLSNWLAVCMVLCSFPVYAGVVADYCDEKWAGNSEMHQNCMRNEEDAAILALPQAEQLALFQQINLGRLHKISKGTLKATPETDCDRVVNYGQIPRVEGVWAVRCANSNMYAVQFDGDAIGSGLVCALFSMYGTSCSEVKWLFDEDESE